MAVRDEKATPMKINLISLTLSKLVKLFDFTFELFGTSGSVAPEAPLI